MELVEERAPKEPIRQFERWRQDAFDAEEPQPEAMALATVSAGGRPSARMVMLRGVDGRGFMFYSNYDSRKAREIAENPWASVVFYWPKTQRQVKVEGSVERLAAEESDAYFQTRPRESRLEAWASPQSRVIAGREWLEDRWEETAARFHDQVPRPEHWGGFRLKPDVVEFWQQGPHRMHDLLCYRRGDDETWSPERLAP